MSPNESISGVTGRDSVHEGEPMPSKLRGPAAAGVRKHVSIAKIAPPKNNGILLRNTVFSLLDGYLDRPLTWISAPAGSGKTTLAASYLTDRKIPCIWYRVDKSDTDIATFFYYMGLAARKAAPRKRRPLPFFAPEYVQDISAFAPRYFEDLFSRLKPPFTIVFDNYHHVPAWSRFHQVICEGLEIVPDGIRVIIVSRQNPPSEFAKLKADAKIGLLGADDVCFSLEETGKMLRLKGLAEVSDEVVDILQEKTRGWAAGLVLMMESAGGNGLSVEALSGLTPHEIFDYFATEVFAGTDAEKREFLLKTAFSPGMTVRSAEKLTGIVRSGEILRQLYRNNFFVEKNSDIDPVYQYHPLFREFLLHRAESVLPPDEIQCIRRISAAILENAGRIEDAADLFIAFGEFEEMTGFIGRHAPVLMAQGRGKTLEGWLKRLPKDVFARSPWLLYWMGVCRLAIDPAESRNYFERSFDTFLIQDDLEGKYVAWCGAVDSILAGWDDYTLLDRWIAWFDREIAGDARFPSPQIEARVVSCMAGALAWRAPHRPDIGHLVDRAMSLSKMAGDPQLMIQTLSIAALCFVMKGDYHGLRVTTEQTKLFAASSNDSPLPCILLKCAEAVLDCTFNANHEQALAAVAKGVEIARDSGVRILDHMLFAHGVYAAFAKGDMITAGDYLDRMKASLAPGARLCNGHYLFLSAWQNLLVGRVFEAKILCEMALRINSESGAVFPEITSHHLLSEILHSKGDYEGADHELSLAKEMISVSTTGEGYYFDHVCLMTDARFAFAAGREQAGLEALKKAMALGRKRGYISLAFCWRPSVMAGLSAKALEHGVEAEYALDVIRCLRLASDAPSTRIENWPWPVKIYTLGGFRLMLDGNPAYFEGKVQKKPLAMLKALIAFGGKDVKEEQFIDLLWPEADGDQAYSAFTTTLLRLRRLMDVDSAVELRDGKLSLNPRCCWVDVWALEEMSVQTGTRLKGIGKPGEEGKIADEMLRRAAGKAIDIYGGPFLSCEGDQPWVLPLRERLRKRYSRLVAGIGSRLEAAQEWEAAAEFYDEALDRDVLPDEELYQRLMLCRQRLGHQSGAIEAYRRCRKALSKTLGVEPSRKTEAIYESLFT